VLGRHKNVACGYYTANKAADGWITIALKGNAGSGTWTENATVYNKLEMSFAGDGVKGQWAENAGDTKLVPLTGSYTGPVKGPSVKLPGKYKYKDSSGETCAMTLTQKGDAIAFSGKYDSDDSDCGAWTGTLAGNMITGEWTSTNKALAYTSGHFYLVAGIVDGADGKRVLLTGVDGADEKDGTPSCDSIGKIELRKVDP
jgi:hypothetical protein